MIFWDTGLPVSFYQLRMEQAFLLGVLKRRFGYGRFRSGQEEIVRTILERKDVLAVLPTGAGKSLCFQLPGLLLPGITLVVSPLISLIKDQTEALRRLGIGAVALDSSMSRIIQAKNLRQVLSGEAKFLYVAPERLASRDFRDFCQKVCISMLVVDEAHCVSQWGRDFRPEYNRISEFVNILVQRPVLAAFTATATKNVQKDILLRLCMPAAEVFVGDFARPNLRFLVLRTGDKEGTMQLFLRRHKAETGIIYCATRKIVEKVTEFLRLQGWPALRYHAGLTPMERQRNQNVFLSGQGRIVVATNAFGLGINKPDVRYVLHYNMPKDVESYYQEAGRAGRDGQAAECLLLYNPEDVELNRFLLAQNNPSGLTAEQDLERLKQMERYCRLDGGWQDYILHYFS